MELYGDRFRFKVRTSEHYAFGAKFRQGLSTLCLGMCRKTRWGCGPVGVSVASDSGLEPMEMKAPSGNYTFEMHHELDGKGRFQCGDHRVSVTPGVPRWCSMRSFRGRASPM